MTTSKTERPWTVKEVAYFFQVRPCTVYKWIERKRISYMKLRCGSIRFRRADIDSFMAEHEAA